MTKWIEYPKEKPTKECRCYVMCDKGFRDCFLAEYCPKQDIFTLYEPESNARSRYPCLQVTHFVQLPDPRDAT